jgi:chaperonin GroEL (HSP60 family)
VRDRSKTSVLADLERAIDDGVHAAKTACKDGKLVPGAGATEMEMALKIRTFADTCPGLVPLTMTIMVVKVGPASDDAMGNLNVISEGW